MNIKLLNKLSSSFILGAVSLSSILANENYSNEHFQKAIESYQNRLFGLIKKNGV